MHNQKMINKLEYSMEYYKSMINHQENPNSYNAYLIGQIQAYENIIKWIIDTKEEPGKRRHAPGKTPGA